MHMARTYRRKSKTQAQSRRKEARRVRARKRDQAESRDFLDASYHAANSQILGE